MTAPTTRAIRRPEGGFPPPPCAPTPGRPEGGFSLIEMIITLSILAMVFRDFKITVSADELRASITAGDLWNVVHRKITPA